MLKVVFFSKFSGYKNDTPIYRPGQDEFFQFGMGQFIAKEFYARDYPVRFENWRTDIRIDEVMEREVEGMNCRIFPSKKIPKFGEYSRQLIKALKEEREKNNEIIFHFIPNHPLNYHYYSKFISKKRIIATHIGGANPYWLYKNSKGIKKWSSFVFYQLEKRIFLKNYNHFISPCKPEVTYYSMFKKPASQIPRFGIPREKDFYIKDRKESRKKLGLPMDKKILLQVGRAIEARGFDWIMEIIDYFQKKEEFFLIFVGINESDPYYQPLKEKGVFMTPYLYHTDLLDYYNAADLLYYLPHGEMDLKFAGTSYVPLEAMVCGTPVVSTTFHHFPGDEVSQVSRIPEKKEDIIPMIEELLAKDVSRELCRQIVLEEFSWDVLIDRYWNIYTNSD